MLSESKRQKLPIYGPFKAVVFEILYKLPKKVVLSKRLQNYEKMHNMSKSEFVK